MNEPTVSQKYADALRIALVENAVPSRRPARRRLWMGTAAIAVLALTGTAGVAAARLMSPPGTPIDASLSEAVHGTFTGTGTLDLGPVPKGATNIKISVTCLSEGTFTFGDFGSMTCRKGDVNDQTWGAVPLGLDQQRTITLETSPTASWSVSAHYTKTVQTEWGVNEAGQTFGAPKGDSNPDLIPVTATNGERGYLHLDDYESDNLEGWTMEDAAEFIEGANRLDRYLPVYASDGSTVIGEFLFPGTDSPPVFRTQ
jgi:hypothetical protein